MKIIAIWLLVYSSHGNVAAFQTDGLQHCQAWAKRLKQQDPKTIKLTTCREMLVYFEPGAATKAEAE